MHAAKRKRGVTTKAVVRLLRTVPARHLAMQQTELSLGVVVERPFGVSSNELAV
jgi:hypothetical protein